MGALNAANVARGVILALAGLSLAACASVGPRYPTPTRSYGGGYGEGAPESGEKPPSKYSGHHVGKPYEINGRWYYPAEQPDYDEVGTAFATANADSLTSLYSSSIAHPMTQDQIRSWGKKFFTENGPSHFKLRKIEFEQLSFIHAVVVVTYAVETKGARGDFSGVERDELARHGGRWFVTSWDKQ